MDPYASENEQIELIKDWWKRNGMPILGGLCIGLGAIYGWRAWQSQVNTRADEASTAYEELLTHVAEHRSESAKPCRAQARREPPGQPVRGVCRAHAGPLSGRGR